MNKVKDKLNGFLEKDKLKGFVKKHCMVITVFAAVLLLVGGVVLAVSGPLAKQPEVDLRSPQYEASPLSDDIDFMPEDAVYYTQEDGVVVIPTATMEINDAAMPRAQFLSTDDTDNIWETDRVVTYNSFTTQEKVKQANGSIGVLTIPNLSLSVNVYTSENELESMTKGLAHFSHSSSWDGNVAICGHNVNYDLTDGYFKNLHTLKTGDEVIFTTSLGERIYKVKTVSEIDETNWSGTARTLENKITMITCISGKPNLRLMVIAEEAK